MTANATYTVFNWNYVWQKHNRQKNEKTPETYLGILTKWIIFEHTENEMYFSK